jgi:predicted dehydrogenase
LIENHNYRFNAPIIAIKQMVQEGVLREVQEVEVRNVLPLRSGGRLADEHLPSPLHTLPAGAIHDFITHLCSLALHFVPQFERVRAAWNNHGGGTLFKYDDLDAILVGGSQHARIRFSCATYPPCFTVTVRGTRGYAETDIYQPYLRCVIPRAGGQQLSPVLNHWINGWGLIRASLSNFRNKVMQRTTYEGLHRILAKTYDALMHGAPMPVSFVDMERTSWLIDALLAEDNWV